MSGRNKRAAREALREMKATSIRDALRDVPDYGVPHWILDGRKVVRANFVEWAVWIETSPGPHAVARTAVNDQCEVSTVFLGIDHNFLGQGPPLLFETMIFVRRPEGRRGRRHEWEENGSGQWRWTTYEDAERGHAMIVEYVRTGVRPDALPEAEPGLLQLMRAVFGPPPPPGAAPEDAN